MNTLVKALLLSAVISTNFSFSHVLANDKEGVSDIKNQIEELKEQSQNSDYDVEAAVAGLYEKIQEIDRENERQLEILRSELTKEQMKNAEYEQEKEDTKKQIEAYLQRVKDVPNQDTSDKDLPQIKYDVPKSPTNDFLINPVPSSKINGYIQDAVNAQGYARMEFAYGPQQIYKIYCKIGYLTDLEFQKGEKITYVGGGDTAQWLIDKADVAQTPHLYVKPIANNVATNIIVNTDKGHVYQILLNSGSWYNPMISWNYGNEDIVNAKIANNDYNDDEVYLAGKTLNVRPENINFSYKIKAKKGNLPKWAPVSVFDDGKKTYIKFNNFGEKLPVLFIKEKNMKDVVWANYRMKNNMFIVDKIFDEAQLQISNADKDIIIVKKD